MFFFSLAMHLKRNMFVLFSASTLISLQNTRCTQRTIWIETENVTFMRFQPMFFFSLGAFSLCRSHRSYGSSCRSSVWIVPLPPSLPCQTVASWLDVLHFMLKHCYHCCNASKYTIMSKKTPWWFNYLLLFFKRTRYLIRFQCSRRQQSIREQDK